MKIELVSTKYPDLKGCCEINFYGEKEPTNKVGEMEKIVKMALYHGLINYPNNSIKLKSDPVAHLIVEPIDDPEF